jgi:hypothetical protein
MTGRNTTAVLVGAVRSIGSLAIVLLVVSAAACSLDIGGIEFHLEGPEEFTHPQEQAAIPFTATGQPVDDGVVCSSGTVTIDHLESLDGETITAEDWADTFDTVMEDAGTVELDTFQDFECGDGSGGFSMKVHHKFDLASFEFEGEQDVGSWRIENGTGSYSDLSGSGDVTLDWDNDDVKYDGDAR